MTITFLTNNAKGLNHPAKRKSLWNEAIQHKCDILCTQETHFHSQKMPRCTHPSFPHVFTASISAKKCGVMTTIKDSVTFKLHSETADPYGRYHILVCDVDSVTYTIANVYAPNVHQVRFLNQVLKKLREVQRGLLVLCGDFNLPSDPHMDSSSTSGRHRHSLQ